MSLIENSLTPLSVLLIADSAAAVEALLGALHEGGYAVAPCHVNKELALHDALHQRHWDIVLLTDDIPDLPTVTALQILRQQDKEVPCLVICSNLDASPIEQALLAGANRHVYREYLALLSPIVRQELAHAEERRTRRAVEAELQKSQADLMLAQQLAQLGSWSHDFATNQVTWSDELWQIMGREPSSAPITFEYFMECVHPEDRLRTQQAIAAANQGGGPRDYYCRIIRPDGLVRVLHVFGTVIKDNTGAIIKTYGTAQDVTERKQAEEELQKSLSLLQATLDSTTDGLLVVDTAGKIISGNKCFDEMWRMPAEIIAARDDDKALFYVLDQLVDPDGFMAKVREVYAHPELESFDVLHFKDGRIFERSSRPHYLGDKCIGLVWSFRDVTERELAGAKLRESETRYRRIVETASEGIWLLDAQNKTEYANQQVADMLGYKVEEMLGRPMLELFSDEEQVEIAPRLEQRRARLSGDRTIHHKRRDGTEVWLHISSNPILDEQGQFAGALAMFTDVTEQKHAEEALLESNAILKATQDAAADGICLVNDQGMLVSFNQRFSQLWQIPDKLLTELHDKGQVMTYVLSNLQDPDEFIDKINFLFDHPDASTHDEILLTDGRIFGRYSARAVSPEGHSYGRIWSFSDLTKRKQYEQELSYQAFHDPLTQLPNRALFMDRLIRALARAERSGKLVGVLFLDLDRFKVVNDSLGHRYGDRLLVQVAERIQVLLRPGDTAARFGGDEFTVLLEDITGVADATVVAERIVESLQTPFIIGNHEVPTGTSIGVALSKSSKDRPEDLLRNADIAMYKVKRSGRGRYEVYEG